MSTLQGEIKLKEGKELEMKSAKLVSIKYKYLQIKIKYENTCHLFTLSYLYKSQNLYKNYR